jgi:hypothetical protein
MDLSHETQLPPTEPALIAGVRAYWLTKRGKQVWPRRRDILPTEIREWLPFVLLVEPVFGGGDFRYRLVGTQLHQYFPNDPTGQLMSEALAPFGERTIYQTIATYRHVLTLDRPMRVRGDGAWFGQPPKYFEALLAPLSDDGVEPNMVFGAFDFQWHFLDMKRGAASLDGESWDSAAAALG